MNRIEEINKFLNYLAKIYSQNPNLPITNDTIYYYLMNYDFSEEELEHRKNKQNFEKWIERFKENKNINVFHADWQYRFLQVVSNGYVKPIAIKLYLSFSKEKVYESVNRLFDYISSNNINVASKVADEMRSDLVVIRLNDKEDAMKIINFVNTDKELSNNCKKTNPFLLKQGNVGIAYDHLLSYNTVLSLLLEFYFKYCRLTNKFDEVSIGTLREYIYNFHKVVFSNNKNIETFLKNSEVFSSIENFRRNKVRAICNYDEIIRLIYQSLSSEMDLEQYFSFYDECVRDGTTKQKYNKYAEIMGKEKDNSYHNSIELLNEYIKYVKLKYGVSYAKESLERYIDGDNNAITNDNDYRQRFIIHLSPDMIMFITNNNISEYISSQLKNKTSIEGYEIFLNACIETYKKYGANHLYNAMLCALNGEYKYFTNGEAGYRDIMMKMELSKNINLYCQMIVKFYGDSITLTDNIYENCTKVVTNMVKNNKETLEKTM